MDSKTLEKKILKEMTSHPEKLTIIADFSRFLIKELKLDYTVAALRYHVEKVALANNISFKANIEDSVSAELEKYKLKVGNSDLQRRYKDLQGRHNAMLESFEDLTQIDQLTVEALDVPRSKDDLENQAVPFIQWSDWHVGKTIKSSVMNNLNEYNPEIARSRALALFDNTLKMVDLHRKQNKITQGVVHLAGDSIEGHLREHSLRENSMTPIEEVTFAAELEITGLEALASSGFFKTLFVLMSRGNHPRLTKKMDSDDYRMNYETLVHHMVVKHFRDSKVLKFVMPESDLGYFDIMGKTIRFFHGHQVQYGGGIGGLTIPLRKAIMNWDMTQHADYNMLGHFHQSYKPLENCMMNGSLCGYDWYAQSIVKAAFQKPLQSMELLVDGRGFRMFTSIDCE